MAKIIITGANRGIGLELAKRLSVFTKPTNICALCRKPDDAKALQDLAKEHKNIIIIKADLTEFSRYDDIVKEIDKSFDGAGISLLINNAGVLYKDQLATVSVKNMEDTFKINTTAPLIFTKALLPLLVKAQNQHSLIGASKAMVLNMSAQLGSIKENTTDDYLSYRISKAGLNMVTKALSLKSKPQDILVVAMHPGWVKTDMGGPLAPITVEDSVEATLKVVLNVEQKHHGCLLSFDGRVIPW